MSNNINWELLMLKFGVQKATEKFEQLALTYVQTVYSEYNWVSTQRTHDNNRDIHLKEYELEQNPDFLDRWAEAKYKKRATSLKKKDLDPTILSGLIHGKVELIIFITNGNVPLSLLSRNYLGANLKNIEIRYVFGRQLENWLIQYPDVYYSIFEETLDTSIVPQNIIEFRNYTFSKIYSKSGDMFKEIECFEIGNRYILDVFIFSTQEGKGKINFLALEGNPFLFINNTDFERADNFKIKIGFYKYSFLVKANSSLNSKILLNLIIDNEILPPIEKYITIKDNAIISLAYSQQLEFVQKINNLINKSQKHMVISVYGNSGVGKTKLLQQIFEDNCMEKNIVSFDFEECSKHSISFNSNYCFLCKITLFITLGSIAYQINSFRNMHIITNIKNELKKRNMHNNFEELIDGCFDNQIAKKAMHNFIKNIQTFSGQEKILNIPFFFIIDNVQNMNREELNIFYKLLSFDEKYGHSIFLLSASQSKFDSLNQEKIYCSNPLFFELTGLSYNDICLSLKSNIDIYSKIKEYVQIEEYMKMPLFLNEFIYQIKLCKEENAIKNLFCNNNILESTTFFNKFDSYFYLLDIIYQFKNGISKKYLTGYYKNTGNMTIYKLNKDIKYLINNHLIIAEDNFLFPFHDYIRSLYFKTRRNSIFNASNAKFYKYLYCNSKNDSKIDNYKVLFLLISSDKRLYNYYRKELMEMFLCYVKKTQYYAAFELGTILFNELIYKKNKTEEECNVLYLYTDCINHTCSSKEFLFSVFNEILVNSSNNYLLKIEIKASKMNERFWQLDVDDLFFEEGKILEQDISFYLKATLKEYQIKRLRRAEYTCYNRMMSAYLLIDKYQSAVKYLEKGKCEIKKNVEKKYILSEEATYYMDYARGMNYENPSVSLMFMEKALNGYNKNKKEHFRRIILCKLDKEVLNSILETTIDYDNMIMQITTLYNEHFISECYKGIIKLFSCRIVYFASKQQLTPKQSIEILTMLDKSLRKLSHTPGVREKFLLNQLLAFLYHISSPEKSIDFLISNSSIISNLGDTYKNINEHNKKYITSIKYIKWGTKKSVFKEDTYYLDPRCW